jgi:hypothetical protein
MKTLAKLSTATMTAMLLWSGCNSQPQNTATSGEGHLIPATTDDHVVKLPTGIRRLPKADWKPMTNEYDWAENFEQIEKGPRHEFPRVVTVFKLPMTEDRRVGVRVSPNEYVEMFVVNPGTLTVQVRLDKKQYWVMSRETFEAKSIHRVDTTTAYRSFYDQEFEWAREAFQPELDSTRYLLQSTF